LPKGGQGANVLPPSYGIGEKDLKDCLKKQDLKLKPGDVVLIRTGQMTRWPDHSFCVNTPGLNREGAEFLAKNGTVMIGADNLRTNTVCPRAQFLPHPHSGRSRGPDLGDGIS
jgi:kynurenine formamidase